MVDLPRSERHSRASRVGWAVAFSLALGLVSCTHEPSPPPWNVILISIDDLRSDHLGCYGYHRETSPTIDRLARQGVRFVNAFTAAPWTLPSHMSMLTSLYPSEHRINPIVSVRREGATLPVLDDAVVTLPEVLKEHGYATAAFTDGAYVSGGLGFAQGFDLYFENEVEKDLPPLQEKLFEWLRANREQKFFVFLHTFAVHLPFTPPAEHLAAVAPEHAEGQLRSFGLFDLVALDRGTRKLTPELLEQIKTLYDGGIRHADAFVESLARELASLGREADTLIIITSDHGEEFQEHGSFGHGYTLHDEVLRVPLIFSGAGVVSGRTIHAAASTVDIMPTVLDLVGIPLGGHESGQSLKPALVGDGPSQPESRAPGESRVVYAETAEGGHLLAVMSGDYKAIHRRDSGSMQLYDLRRDPGETHDLAAEQADVARTFARLVAEYRDRDALGTVGEVPIDEALHEKLKALGYVAE